MAQNKLNQKAINVMSTELEFTVGKFCSITFNGVDYDVLKVIDSYLQSGAGDDGEILDFYPMDVWGGFVYPPIGDGNIKEGTINFLTGEIKELEEDDDGTNWEREDRLFWADWIASRGCK